MYAAAKYQGMEVRNCEREQRPNQIARDVERGLSAAQKFIPSKYFYDARGSRLFDQICTLPEYYLTRTEMILLRAKARALIRDFDEGDLVELGSGANWKIRTLLNAMSDETRSRSRYVAVDVSESALIRAGGELARLYPGLEVLAVIADFTIDLHRLPTNRKKLMFFFGSTIGNLDRARTALFLEQIRACLRPGDRFVLGMDMVKSIDLLEAAYNDSRQVTAAFNRNVLHVVNRELSADFDPDHFDHLAFFNEKEERIEMHLQANRDVDVYIRGLGMLVSFEKGETILTEICRKFRRQSAEHMIAEAGMKILAWHTDSRRWFSLAEIEAG